METSASSEAHYAPSLYPTEAGDWVLGQFRIVNRLLPPPEKPQVQRAGPTLHLLPQPTTYHILTTCVFYNIPALCSYLLCFQIHSSFVAEFSTAVLCFQ
jgi:hypothetical protein